MKSISKKLLIVLALGVPALALYGSWWDRVKDTASGAVTDVTDVVTGKTVPKNVQPEKGSQCRNCTFIGHKVQCECWDARKKAWVQVTTEKEVQDNARLKYENEKLIATYPSK